VHALGVHGRLTVVAATPESPLRPFWKSADRFEGDLRAGKKHDQGNFIGSSGDCWEGEFKNDDRTEMLPSGTSHVFGNRVGWA